MIRLPSFPAVYDSGWGNIYSRSLEQSIGNLQNLVPPRAYGSFFDTTTQTAAAINTAYAVTLNTTDLSFGVGIDPIVTSRMVFTVPGVYNYQFSGQFDKSSGSAANLYIWIRQNGIDVLESAGKLTLQGSSAAMLPAWNYYVRVAKNDYIELMWSVTNTGIILLANAASSPVPAIPSMIVTAHTV